MRHYFYYAIIVIVACASTIATHATSKLTPNARLALFQKQVADKSSYQLKANNAIADIRLVVEVDARQAASTFQQIREAGGHRAVQTRAPDGDQHSHGHGGQSCRHRRSENG